MAKPKPDELADELKKQEDEVYGTGYTDGDPGKFENTEDMLEDVIGNSPTGDEEEEEEEKEGFSIADAVAKDEAAIAEDKPLDPEEEELESELEKEHSSDEK